MNYKVQSDDKVIGNIAIIDLALSRSVMIAIIDNDGVVNQPVVCIKKSDAKEIANAILELWEMKE